MLVDRIIFFYAAIGFYMFFLFAIHPEKCPVSTGLYIFLSIVASYTRPYYDILKINNEVEATKYEIIFNIGMDLACAIYGTVEVLRFCVNETIMWWLIVNVGNHTMFVIPQIFLFRRKNDESTGIPLVGSDESLASTYIDI